MTFASGPVWLPADVSANADPSTAMVIEYGNGELRGDTGTSSSTPLGAGVIALADQQAGWHLGFVNPAIYAIGRSPAYHRAFHDVITSQVAARLRGRLLNSPELPIER